MEDYRFETADQRLVRRIDTGETFRAMPGSKAFRLYQNWLNAGNTTDPFAPPVETTSAEEIDGRLASDKFIRVLIKVLAIQFDKTPAQVRNWLVSQLDAE